MADIFLPGGGEREGGGGGGGVKSFSVAVASVSGFLALLGEAGSRTG